VALQLFKREEKLIDIGFNLWFLRILKSFTGR